VETGKNLTFVVYDRSSLVAGVSITPGPITRVQIAPANENTLIATGKQVLYRISFLPNNPVPQAGFFQMICTNNFQFAGLFEIEYGVSDRSSTQSASLVYTPSNFTLSLSNFASFSPQMISILALMTNPSISGVTDPVVLRSLMPDGVSIIDENFEDALVVVSSISAPTSATVSFPSGSQAAGTSINTMLSFSPNYDIPASGWVSFVLPAGFTVAQSQTCFVKPTNEVEQPSPTCYFANGSVFVQLFADSVGVYGKFEAGLISYIRVTSLISPLSSGNSIFDFTTYTQALVLLESGSALATLTASALSLSASVLHSGQAHPTILTLQFTLTKSLPSSVPVLSFPSPSGFIELQLPTLSGASVLFAPSLGLASLSVPCFSSQGLVSPQCSITTAPSSPSTPVFVTVSGFAAVAAGTTVVLQLAGLAYVSSAVAPSVTVTTYVVSNRVRTNLESGSFLLPAGSAVPATTVSPAGLTLSQTSVLQTTTLSTAASFNTATSSGAISAYVLIHIYKTHDQGYCNTANPVCYVDGAVKPCTCFDTVDMVLIPMAAALAAGAHTFQLQGMITPGSVAASNDDLLFYVIGGQTVKQVLSFSSKIPMLTPGPLNKFSVIPSDFGQGYVFVSYSILLIASHSIPSGGSLSVSFPPEYSLSSSSPLPTCSCSYVHFLSSASLCSLSGNTFTLSSFASLPAGFNLVLSISGVKNPSVSLSSSFSAATRNGAGWLVDQLPGHQSVPHQRQRHGRVRLRLHAQQLPRPGRQHQHRVPAAAVRHASQQSAVPHGRRS
jgi:hypothetical protein